jgi:hypothetical protein
MPVTVTLHGSLSEPRTRSAATDRHRDGDSDRLTVARAADSEHSPRFDGRSADVEAINHKNLVIRNTATRSSGNVVLP